MPDAKSREVLGAQRLGDGAQAVVSGEPPADLQLQSTGFEVEFVVRDDQAVRRPRATCDAVTAASAAPDSFM